MAYETPIQNLREEFIKNPGNFVAEADLQVRLVELIRDGLSDGKSTVENPTLEGTPSSYKEGYWKKVQEGLETHGEIDRVHTEVSVEQGERVDVVVFKPEIEKQIEWVSNGSKRFSASDIEAVIELKFVKNKYKFPKQTGITVDGLKDRDPSVEELQKSGDLDFSENNIGADIKELNGLEEVPNRYLVLFSNNNYLFEKPLSEEESDYNNSELYSTMGEAARNRISDELDDGVEFLYTHPRTELKSIED